MNGKIYNSLFCVYMLVCGLLFLTGGVEAALGSDPKEDLKAANDAMLKVKSYRVHMTESSEGKTRNTDMEVVPPNRVHWVTKEGIEMIIIPEGTYQKSPNGKWQKLPTNMGNIMEKYRSQGAQLKEEILKNEQVRLIGPDTLDGKPMMVYEIIYPGLSKSQVWIGTDDHLIRKEEIESEVKEFKVAGKTYGGKSKTTMLITDYNAPIKIVAPTL